MLHEDGNAASWQEYLRFWTDARSELKAFLPLYIVQMSAIS